MSVGNGPVRCDGNLAILQAGYAYWRVGGRAGRQSGDDEADLLLFAAGRGAISLDLIRLFLNEEMAALDWLADYLRHDDTTLLLETLAMPEDEETEEEAEIAYDRRALSASREDYIFEP